MKLSLYEQETIINFNAEEKFMEIYTADPVMMRKLDKLCNTNPELYKLKREDECSKTYVCENKKMLSLRKPRILTEEQRKEISKRLRKNLV